MVLVNSEKGKNVFETIKNELIAEEKSFDEAATGNRVLYGHYKQNAKYKEYRDDFEKIPVFSLMEKYFDKSDNISMKHKILMWIRDHEYIFLEFLKRKLRTVFIKKI